MDSKILLSELAEKLALQSEISKRAAESFLRTFFALIEQNMLSDRYVKIKDIGTFKLVDVNDRESVNVATGERIQIESHSKISFVAEGKLRDLINRPFAYLTNIELEDETTMEELNNVDKASAIEGEASETPEEAPAEQTEDVGPAPTPAVGIMPPVAESIEPVIQTPAAQGSTPLPEKAQPAREAEAEAPQEPEPSLQTAEPTPLATAPIPPTAEPVPATGTLSATPHNQAQEIALALLKIIETAQGSHLTPQELVSAFQTLQTPAAEPQAPTSTETAEQAEEEAREPLSATLSRRERRRARRGGKRISTPDQQQEQAATPLAAPATDTPAEKPVEQVISPVEEAESPVMTAEKTTPRPVRLKDRQNARRRTRAEIRHTAPSGNKVEEAAVENLDEKEEVASAATPVPQGSQPAGKMPATPAVGSTRPTQPAPQPSTSLSQDAVASLEEIMQSPTDLMAALQEVTQSPQEVMEVLRTLVQDSEHASQPQEPAASNRPQDTTEEEFTTFVRPVRRPRVEEEKEEEKKPEWKRFLKVGLIVLAALILIGVAFWYFYLRESRQEVKDAPPGMEQAMKTNAAEKALVDSICENELKALDNQAANAVSTDLGVSDHPENIEQLPNAAYEILGTAEVHTMETGETLNYLALKTLGTGELVNYIIFYNDPTVLANLAPGSKVKIPTLRRRSTGEIINKKYPSLH